MNTDPIPATPARLSRPNSGPLVFLDFGLSNIKDPFAIAKWFGDACTADGITFIKYCTGVGAPTRIALWEQVRRAVALLQEARLEGAREGAREVEMQYKAANGGGLGR
jgi:hypothetical protein